MNAVGYARSRSARRGLLLVVVGAAADDGVEITVLAGAAGDDGIVAGVLHVARRDGVRRPGGHAVPGAVALVHRMSP